MNRIVLIGNGFDLAHGLKTNYKDFIDNYWEEFIYNCVSQDRLNISGRYKYDCIELIIPQDLLTLSHFLPDAEYPYRYPFKEKISYSALMEYIHDYNEEERNKNQKIQFKINNFFLFHLFEKCSKEMAWVDIENEYYKFLCSRLTEQIPLNYNYASIDLLNKDFEHIKTLLENYLNNLIEKNKPQKSEYIERLIYSNYSVDELTEVGRKEVILNEVSKIKRYLQSSDFNCISHKTLEFPYLVYDNIEELLSIQANDRDFWNRYFDLKPDDMMFLSFNYSKTEMLYINMNKTVDNKFIPSDIHIHGELNNPKNPIIFGYGDELEENYSKLENLQDNAYLENIKSIKYQETDNYKQMLSFVNSDQYQVIILGHSCGNSDRTLLNTLFEHENCVSIKPYYYQYKDEKGEIKDNYSDIVRNISRSFKDKKSMRDKVVNKTYTTWFSSNIKE